MGIADKVIKRAAGRRSPKLVGSCILDGSVERHFALDLGLQVLEHLAVSLHAFSRPARHPVAGQTGDTSARRDPLWLLNNDQLRQLGTVWRATLVEFRSGLFSRDAMGDEALRL